MNNSRLTLAQYTEGLTKGDRVVLSKAITLAESNLPNDQILSSQLVEAISKDAGKSIRVGITGVPGVGKSTFIEAFGKMIIDAGFKIAVLTVDPSSQISGGSILGDKTRMETLSKNKNAYVRPTASGNFLGGTANKTREAMLLCEAAGFDVIIIETVGVGQSEVSVRDMVDFFLLLMLAGAGDELQGIKKGIMEMADAIVITKADGDNIQQATRARTDYQHALHLFPSKASGWNPVVTTCSALTGEGIDDVWKIIQQYVAFTKDSGFFQRQRSRQQVNWFKERFESLLLNDISRRQLHNHISLLSNEVMQEAITPYEAARKLLAEYYRSIKQG